MSLLECTDLTKEFGGLTAVEDVSLSVERGEIVGLIGPNGAGKSTLFKMIAGELRPTRGRIVFDGDDVTGLAPHQISRRGIGKTHQIVRPFDNMTVRENVEVASFFGQSGRSDATDHAREVLGFAGLEAFEDRQTDDLTIGMLKRLEIARVLAADPELLLLDEAAGGLDHDEVHNIIGLIGEIAEEGKTVFLIDHVMRALMSVSDRVIVLNEGKVLARGTPAEIQNDPEVLEAYLGEGGGPAEDEPSGGVA